MLANTNYRIMTTAFPMVAFLLVSLSSLVYASDQNIGTYTIKCTGPSNYYCSAPDCTGGELKCGQYTFFVSGPSETYPNDNTKNGYEFMLGPKEEVDLHLLCTAPNADGLVPSHVGFSKNDVKCKVQQHGSTPTYGYKYFQCKNKSGKSHHHLDLTNYTCG